MQNFAELHLKPETLARYGFINHEGYNLVVYPTKARRWGYKIGDRFGPRTYPTANEAKLALLDDFWAATQDDAQLWSTD